MIESLTNMIQAWVSYVTNAPLQNTTHQLRFPLVLCLIFLVIPVVIEVLRTTLKVFKKDMLRWQDKSDDGALATQSTGSGN
jgi:hypothetical protein